VRLKTVPQVQENQRTVSVVLQVDVDDAVNCFAAGTVAATHTTLVFDRIRTKDAVTPDMLQHAVITSSVTSTLDLLAVGPKFTRPACHMQPTMRIARHSMALLLPRALPVGQKDVQTDTAPF